MSLPWHQRLRGSQVASKQAWNHQDVSISTPESRASSVPYSNHPRRHLKAKHLVSRAQNLTAVFLLALAGVICGVVFAYNISVARKHLAQVFHKLPQERERGAYPLKQAFKYSAVKPRHRKRLRAYQGTRMMARKSDVTASSRPRQLPPAKINLGHESNIANTHGDNYSPNAAKSGAQGIINESSNAYSAQAVFSASSETKREFRRSEPLPILQGRPMNFQTPHGNGVQGLSGGEIKHAKARSAHKTFHSLKSYSSEDREPIVMGAEEAMWSIEHETQRWRQNRELRFAKGAGAGAAQNQQSVGQNSTSVEMQEQCQGNVRPEECYRDVIEFAAKYQENGTVTILVCTAGSHDVVVNWCVSMQRLSLRNYFLVALDRETYRYFSERKAPVVEVSGLTRGKRISKSEIWVERTHITHAILKAGINVLVSDADAVMMKSPFQNSLSRFEDVSYDIISSPSNFPSPLKENELPAECPRAGSGDMEWRHQPCMGWILFRATHRMLEFFTTLLLPDVLKFKDDQIGLNCAIRKAGAVWNDGWYWTIRWTMTTISERPKLKIGVLPGAYFVRNCTEYKKDRERGYGIYNFNAAEVEMYHCKGYHKQANARNNGFWFIREDWNKTISPGATFHSYLESVSA